MAFYLSFRDHLLELPGLPPTVIKSLGKPVKPKANNLGSNISWKLEAAAMTALLAGGRLPADKAKSADAGDAKKRPTAAQADSPRQQRTTLGNAGPGAGDLFSKFGDG